MVTIQTEINITTTTNAIALLLQIRAEVCDGKTRIKCTPENDYKIAILKKLELVDSRIVEPNTVIDDYQQDHYVGVTSKGRDLCKRMGFY